MSDRYEARRRANGQSLALTRASRRNSPRIRLTQRGENVVAVLYAAAGLIGMALLLLASLGLAGWIETHP
jgi:hypothetical protein